MQFYLFFNTILISFQINSLHFSLFYRIFEGSEETILLAKK